jgi:hypothetical protein
VITLAVGCPIRLSACSESPFSCSVLHHSASSQPAVRSFALGIGAGIIAELVHVLSQVCG